MRHLNLPDKKYPIFFLALISVIFIVYFFHTNEYRANYRCETCNIILISIDTLRQDHLGVYGYQRNTTPYIDHFSNEAYIYTNLVSQKPKTTPAMFSLFTGYQPFYIDNGQYIYDYQTVVPELSKKGFFTIGIVGTNILDKKTGFERGFNIFLDTADLKTSGDKATVNASEIVLKTVDIIKKNAGKKLFVWVHFKDPHTRYIPPKDYASLFNYIPNRKIIPIINNDSFDGLGGIPRFAVINNSRDLDYYISQYDGEIRFVDSQIGVLLDSFKMLNKYNNSLIIITADHGESLGENDYYFEHGAYIDDANIKIPLLIKFPNQRKNYKIEDTVILADIYQSIQYFINNIAPDNTTGLPLIPSMHELQSRKIFLESVPQENSNLKFYGLINNNKRYVYEEHCLFSDETITYCIPGDNNIKDYIKDYFKLYRRDKQKNENLNYDALRSLGYIN